MRQGTQAWFEARVGRLTASRIGDATKRLQKGGWAATRRGVMTELTAERLTGQPAEHFVSGAMEHGRENEATAAQAYEFLSGNRVSEVGFVEHPRIAWSGASPDRLIGEDGGLEIKCPTTETHIATLLAGAEAPGYIPDENRAQLLWGLACTGRQWWDFCSYDPRVPLPMQIYTARLERTAKIEIEIVKLEADARDFLAELDERVTRLTALYA